MVTGYNQAIPKPLQYHIHVAFSFMVHYHWYHKHFNEPWIFSSGMQNELIKIDTSSFFAFRHSHCNGKTMTKPIQLNILKNRMQDIQPDRALPPARRMKITKNKLIHSFTSTLAEIFEAARGNQGTFPWPFWKRLLRHPTLSQMLPSWFCFEPPTCTVRVHTENEKMNTKNGLYKKGTSCNNAKRTVGTRKNKIIKVCIGYCFAVL